MKHVLVATVLACASSCAIGQSLLRTDPAFVPASPASEGGAISDGAPQPSAYELASRVQAPMRGLSLTQVEPPPPRDFAVHDLITIIISETSRQSSAAKLDTKKDASLTGEIKQLPDLSALLEGQLKTGNSDPLVKVGASGNSKFKGDGKYERTERFTDRITATVIDVKPNGTLVLEARRTIGKDKEVQTLVLAGQCRREDVTSSNTVLSSQLAELTLSTISEGEVTQTSEKGFFTRLFDTIFNF